MFYGGGFPRYVPVAERRQQAARRVAALAKRGVEASPVVVQGRAIARTFWGRAWCDNLESYSDYANRLPRGRTYVRNGSVIHLCISQGRVSALVSGSSIYEVEVTIRPLPAARWRAITRECAGRIDSVVELLAGRLSDGVMEVLCRQGEGLFPGAREISLRCSCPDGAYLCKHLAAVLYGVGARLDQQPELLFVLRGVDKEELVGCAVEGSALARDQARPNALAGGELSELFGIDLDPGGAEHAGSVQVKVPPSEQRGGIRGRTRPKPEAPRARTRRNQWVTARELVARGLHRSTIQRWLAAGILLRSGERGRYLKTRETEARIAEYLRSLR